MESKVAATHNTLGKEESSSEDENNSPDAAKKYADKLQHFLEHDEEEIENLLHDGADLDDVDDDLFTFDEAND